MGVLGWGTESDRWEAEVVMTRLIDFKVPLKSGMCEA